MNYESTTSRIDSLTELESESGGEYIRWQTEINGAEKELEKWKKAARKIVRQFRAEPRQDPEGGHTWRERKFNLFSANVQILETALFNQTPKPNVDREFKDQNDEIGRVSAEILERALTCHNSKSQNIDNVLKAVVQDNLVPGVGCSWHTYEADFEKITEEGVEYDAIAGERIVDDYVYWEDLLWSPARMWEEVRWLARKTYLTRDALIKRFGKELGKKIPLDYTNKRQDNLVTSKNEVFQQAIIYEIWNKEGQNVIWLSKGYEKILDQKDDFLELDGFFPCPKPLFAVVSNGQVIPIPDFQFCKDQYLELNEVNTRIALLIKACRVAGAYDKGQPALANIMNNAGENQLVPVDSWAAFAEKGGVKGAIDWVPVDQIAKVLIELYKGREDIKAQIYEVSGMSDIIRGATKASETLGAQKIKAQYASMRIQDRQKAVTVYVSEVFNIQGQIMRKHFQIQTIEAMAQVQYMNEDPQLVQQGLQLLQSPEFELRCEVESDTLSDIDFQSEKQARIEYMTSVTTYLEKMAPIIQNDPILGPFLVQLLQFSLAGFAIGKKFESELDKALQAVVQKAAQPKQPQPTPEEQKVKAEIGLMQQEAQLDAQGKQQELQFRGQEQQMKLQGIQAEAQAKAQAQWAKLRQDQIADAQKNRQMQQKMMLDAQAAAMKADQQPQKPTIQ